MLLPILIKQAVSKLHEEGDEKSVWTCLQVKLCLFDLNLSMKPVKKFFFVYECKLILSLALLHLAYKFINKLNFIFFTEWFLIQ